MSKRANADYYSKMMAEKGRLTVALDANFDAIQNFADQQTISEAGDVAAKGAGLWTPSPARLPAGGHRRLSLCHRGCR